MVTSSIQAKDRLHYYSNFCLVLKTNVGSCQFNCLCALKTVLRKKRPQREGTECLNE